MKKRKQKKVKAWALVYRKTGKLCFGAFSFAATKGDGVADVVEYDDHFRRTVLSKWVRVLITVSP